MTDDKDKSEETKLFLLEQKISYINTGINVCMAWWVSSVVFCGSILAAIWLNRVELVESGVIKWFGFVLAFFFATVVIFGILIIKSLERLRREIFSLAVGLNQERFFFTELTTCRWAMVSATSSFALILIAWIILWIGLWLGYWHK